jgi:hypothetical protein
VSGAATHIAYFISSTDFARETAEQFPVKWLPLKLVINPAGVLIRDLVVALTDCSYLVVNHRPRDSGSDHLLRAESKTFLI